jgi:rhodanese-related sulfurtransferase
VLVGSPPEVREARLRLARVGIDTVVGAVTDLHTLSAHPELTSTQSRLTAAVTAQRIRELPDLQVVDVRGAGEFASGALPGAVNLPLPQLRSLLTRLDPARPVLVNCAGGYRSIAAASMLRANGFTDVSDLLGGWTAWQAERRGA